MLQLILQNITFKIKISLGDIRSSNQLSGISLMSYILSDRREKHLDQRSA